MKHMKRIAAVVLAAITLLTSVHSTADNRVDRIFWEIYGEYFESFWCASCDDLLPVDDGFSCKDPECDDDILYCENCICSSCDRCYEHCICDFNPDDYLDMDAELSIPEPTEVNYSVMEELASRDLS